MYPAHIEWILDFCQFLHNIKILKSQMVLIEYLHEHKVEKYQENSTSHRRWLLWWVE